MGSYEAPQSRPRNAVQLARQRPSLRSGGGRVQHLVANCQQTESVKLADIPASFLEGAGPYPENRKRDGRHR